VSTLNETGTSSDNIKLNMKRNFFHIYKVGNARKITQLIEKVEQKL